MEKEKEYFKIYNICERQVLIEKDFEDEDTWELHIKFYFDNNKADLTIKYSTEELLNKAFDAITKESAEKIVIKTLTEF